MAFERRLAERAGPGQHDARPRGEEDAARLAAEGHFERAGGEGAHGRRPVEAIAQSAVQPEAERGAIGRRLALQMEKVAFQRGEGDRRRAGRWGGCDRQREAKIGELDGEGREPGISGQGQGAIAGREEMDSPRSALRCLSFRPAGGAEGEKKGAEEDDEPHRPSPNGADRSRTKHVSTSSRRDEVRRYGSIQRACRSASRRSRA